MPLREELLSPIPGAYVTIADMAAKISSIRVAERKWAQPKVLKT